MMATSQLDGGRASRSGLEARAPADAQNQAQEERNRQQNEQNDRNNRAQNDRNSQNNRNQNNNNNNLNNNNNNNFNNNNLNGNNNLNSNLNNNNNIGNALLANAAANAAIGRLQGNTLGGSSGLLNGGVSSLQRTGANGLQPLPNQAAANGAVAAQPAAVASVAAPAAAVASVPADAAADAAAPTAAQLSLAQAQPADATASAQFVTFTPSAADLSSGTLPLSQVVVATSAPAANGVQPMTVFTTVPGGAYATSMPGMDMSGMPMAMPDEINSSSGLSGGAIGGIVVGVLVGVAVTGTLLYSFWLRHKGSMRRGNLGQNWTLYPSARSEKQDMEGGGHTRDRSLDSWKNGRVDSAASSFIYQTRTEAEQPSPPPPPRSQPLVRTQPLNGATGVYKLDGFVTPMENVAQAQPVRNKLKVVDISPRQSPRPVQQAQSPIKQPAPVQQPSPKPGARDSDPPFLSHAAYVPPPAETVQAPAPSPAPAPAKPKVQAAEARAVTVAEVAKPTEGGKI